MKLISDIRLFKSSVDNTDGNPLPECINNKYLNATAHRIAMKLRENKLSLGEYDHLYVNFTTRLPIGITHLAKRSVDPYHKWYRFFDVGIEQKIFDGLNSDEYLITIMELLQNLLVSLTDENIDFSIKDCICQVIENGEEMLMLYKTKQTAELKANIHLQYLNNGQYVPHLSVCNLNGNVLLNEKLSPAYDMNAIGEIHLSRKKVTVTPRKNSLSKDLSPIVFEL